MFFWCFDDFMHDWGKQLMAAAIKRGHEAMLFDHPRIPTHGLVFMHMHHHPTVRQLHKNSMAVMATNPNLTLIPDYRSSVLYDDKLEQLRHLAKWMPKTAVFHSSIRAREHLDSGKAPMLPFMSKSREGASSHNVRFIRDHASAIVEIRAAFSDVGIRMRHGLAQRGYLMWQSFIPDNEYDLRIIAIGQQRLVLKRYNREDRPMASGSGKLEPVRKLNNEIASALEHADQFFREEEMKWCAIDLIRDKPGKRWYILETAVGWTMPGYAECVFFDGGKPTGKTGADVWNVLIDEVERGSFGEVK